MPLLRTSLGLVALLLSGGRAHAQAELPVLEARAPVVDVQDGSHLWKGIWTIDPAVAVDVYHARRSAGPKTVTFVSDVDSLSFEVEPGNDYDFIVMLGGEHACRTRISTRRQAYRRAPGASVTGPDVIPFRLVDGKIHVEATVNGSAPLDLMFDTGADNLVLHPSALAKGAALRFDGSMPNAGLGGTLTRQTSGGNRLEVAGLTWEHEMVLYIENRSRDGDGILGYVAFEDRVLEIDYGRSVLRVHDGVPPDAGFTPFPFRYEGTILAMEAAFDTGASSGTGWFIVDTGLAGSLHLDERFASEHGLYDQLDAIGRSESRGVGPGVLRNRIVLLPQLRFGDHTLVDVPTHLEEPGQDRSLSTGCLLGMDILQRFDTILDFPHERIHLRPNARFRDPFDVRASGPPRSVILVGACILALATVLGLRRLRSRRRGAA